MLCSDHEGTPTALLEAIGRGVPYLTNRNSGIDNLLPNCGIVVEENSSDSFSREILSILENPSRLIEMQQCCNQVSGLSWRERADEISDAFYLKKSQRNKP